MEIQKSNRRILQVLILTSLLLFTCITNLYAADNYGVIIVTDSGNPEKGAIGKRIDQYIISLRKINNISKKTLTIFYYDFNRSGHSPYITQVLKISKSKTPLVALGKMGPGGSFGGFFPGSKMNNVNNARQGAERVMGAYRETLPESRRASFVSRITGFTGIKTTPGDANVYIDNKFMGKSPVSMKILLVPGEHSIKIKKEKYEDYEEMINLNAGDFNELNCDLQLARGTLEVATSPSGAQVEINGEVKGTTPTKIELAPGEYQVGIKKKGYKYQQESVTIEGTGKVVRNFKLEANKVKCYLEVKGYYVKERVRMGPRSFATKTFAIDPANLSRKIKGILERQELIEFVSAKGQSDLYIIYEAWPKSPIEGKMTIYNNKNGRKIFERKRTISRPSSDEEKLALEAARLFNNKFLPVLNQIILKYISKK
ncbi:MAG: PEGA domain-containing protein [Candidatus Eremiobacteraeota bacterium]|nr:PEGA domain-containing protein [Candidatus Eremiobacteraeota bacterium]